MPKRSGFVRGVFAVAAVSAILGAVWTYRWSVDRRANEPGTARLTNGATLRLWRVTFGTNHAWRMGRFPSLDGLRNRVPRLQSLIGPPTVRIASFRAAEGSGICAFYGWRASTGEWRSSPPWLHAFRDGHGCRMQVDSGRGEASEMGMPMVRQISQLYPRRDAAFEAEFVVDDPPTGETVRFRVTNPKPWEGAEWTPEPVPAVREVEGLRVTFLGYGGDARWVAPRFRVERDGVAVPEWRAGRFVFRDVTGNEAESPVLCRHEPAWEIEAWFEREWDSPFGPDEIWTVHDGGFPEAGRFVDLQESRKLQEVTVSVTGFGGPGRFRFEKSGGAWVMTSEEDVSKAERRDGMSSGSDGKREWLEVNRRSPWVMVSFAGVRPEHTWCVLARDATGKLHRSSGYSGQGKAYFVPLEVPEGVAVADVRVLVQRRRKVAFTVAPPKIEVP